MVYFCPAPKNYFMKNILLVTAVLCLTMLTRAQEVLQWRGADRTGYYLREKELLKNWPPDGPTLLWEFDQLGNGYGSPVITEKNIFINGEIDTISYLFALDLTGKFLWKAPIGKEWVLSYPGSRSTPTVVGDLVYVTAGWGTVACLEAKTGKQKWSANLITDFHGPVTRFGFSECLLVEGNDVFFSAGNADTNVVALDRFTGKIRWICKGLGEMTSYCSPQIIRLPQRNIMVTFSKNALLGIDMKDGRLLWSHKQEGEGDVHVNTPLYENGFIYYITGDGNGSVKLKLSDDGTEITQVWRNPACDNTIGGFIKLNDYLYASSYGKRKWYSLNAGTGEIADSLKFDKGVTIYADGMLYLYNEKGQIGIFRPGGATIEPVSSFRVTRGTKAHYAHPVICGGILYIRHGMSLLAYDIKAK
jgi:outer membrane protein assembly factor BamB